MPVILSTPEAEEEVSWIWGQVDNLAKSYLKIKWKGDEDIARGRVLAWVQSPRLQKNVLDMVSKMFRILSKLYLPASSIPASSMCSTELLIVGSED
jgi:hypothetical protein